MKTAFFTIAFLGALHPIWSNMAFGVEGICIEDATGKRALAIVNGHLVLTDPTTLDNATYEPLWRIPTKERDGHILLIGEGSSRHRNWGLEYDEKSKTVTTNPIGMKWTLRAGAIQAAEGEFKGLYIAPGTEKVEVEVKGKKVLLGTRPTLTEKPYSFQFVESGG